MRYLIVTATEAEAAYVPSGLEVVVTGIGKTAAAVGTTHALSGRHLDDLTVINIGSAGALRDGLAGIYVPGTVINHDINAEAVRAIGLDPADTLPVPASVGR